MDIPGNLIDTTATLTLWRVFGLGDNFSDRPEPYWSTDAAVVSSPTDRIAVTIGSLPDELLTTLRQWRAQIRGNLNTIAGHITTPEQRLEMYHQDIGSVPLPEFENDPYVAWLTVRVERSIEIQVPEVGELSWGPSTDEINNKILTTFEDEGNPRLDCAVASVIGGSNGLSVRHMRFAERRPYLTAPGKAAITIRNTQMTIKDSGITIGRNNGWAGAPINQITTALSSIASVHITKKVSNLIAQPMSWLSSALGEEDDLRRFTFAYAGLELLVTQVEKNDRDELIGTIQKLDGDLPVTELLWPTTNEDFVWRNLVFRFAVTATIYAPETANIDVATFKRIARAGNEMFHGSEQSITCALSLKCTELLTKYVGLVAARLTSTPQNDLQ